MFTPNSYLMNLMADAHREDLLQEAAARRLISQFQKEQKQMNKDSVLTDTTVLTWRRRWQQLLVGAGLATALLLSGCQPVTVPSAPVAQTVALATAPVVTVKTSDYAFEAPTEINIYS